MTKCLLKFSIVLVFLIAVTASGQTRTLGTIEVEGVGAKAAKGVREIIAHHLDQNFDPEDVQGAIAALYSQGTFNDIEVYYEEAGAKTNVIFRLIPVRLIRTVEFAGNRSYSKSDLLAELGFGEGEGYSAERIKGGIENVKKFYNLNGFLNAEVSAQIDTAENGSDLAVKVTIKEHRPCLIEDISFQGVNKRLNTDLEKNFRGRKKKNLSQNLLTSLQAEVTDYLFKEHYFSSSVTPPEQTFNVERTSVKLSYVVNAPYKFSLVFEGNKDFDAEKIFRALNLDAADRLSTSPVDDLTERILRFYKKMGYANVAVKYKESLLTQEFIRRIVFDIDEGARVRIKDILIDGNFSRPQKYYRSFIFDHSGDLVGKKIYNSEDLETGLKNLVIELQNQGYIGAKMTGTRIDFDKNRSQATIKVMLEEGPRTFIEKINFTGLKNTTRDELEKTIGLKAHEPLQLSRLDESVAKILELYRSRGYLDVKIANQGQSLIAYSADNTKATLTFDIGEGPQITVGSIVVEGNTFTKDYVITRELQFRLGEVLTPESIAYSLQRLQRLSIFTGVDIRTLEEDPQQGARTVLVRVTEHDPGIFRAGVGVNNELGLSLKGFLGGAYRNLFGTGRGINARLEGNYKVQYDVLEYGINLGYTEPFIFGTSNTGRLNLTRSKKLFEIDALSGLVYALDTSQADLSLERDITRYLKLIYEFYGIAHTNEYEIKGKVATDSTGTITRPSSKVLDIATTGPTLLLDKRDNPFNPTRGFVGSFSFEFSNPRMGSSPEVSYYKSILGYTQYIPLGPLIWANEAKGGYMKNLSDWTINTDAAIPTIKAFVLGGRSTIRGFNPISESIPLIKDYPQGIITDSHFYLFKSEVRFPISGNLGGVVFYDGGHVGITGDRLTQTSYSPRFWWRDSAGLGIRYNTPVGPVSLEYGFKLNRDESLQRQEDPGAWHFSIGVF